VPDISSMTRIAVPQIKCLGKTASTWDSSISAAIGDELAAIHDHMEHSRNADCQQAKAFLMGFSPLVSNSVLYLFNTVANTMILQKTRYQATQTGPNSYKDKAKKAE
jgi:hypothetical protein